ncbi:MAG TPA: hypothetical protein VEU08_17150 [Vicinamibacterales bacterium]|nr:hypothetical protein [Vicinamibacterales bacterium]
MAALHDKTDAELKTMLRYELEIEQRRSSAVRLEKSRKKVARLIAELERRGISRYA